MLNRREEILKRLKEINESYSRESFLGLDAKGSESIKSNLGRDNWDKWYEREMERGELMNKLFEIG